jgi:hypothetical protein
MYPHVGASSRVAGFQVERYIRFCPNPQWQGWKFLADLQFFRPDEELSLSIISDWPVGGCRQRFWPALRMFRIECSEEIAAKVRPATGNHIDHDQAATTGEVISALGRKCFSCPGPILIPRAHQLNRGSESWVPIFGQNLNANIVGIRPFNS